MILDDYGGLQTLVTGPLMAAHLASESVPHDPAANAIVPPLHPRAFARAPAVWAPQILRGVFSLFSFCHYLRSPLWGRDVMA